MAGRCPSRNARAPVVAATSASKLAWSFKGNWSGCESYVFIPDGMTVSPIDSTSMWSTDLDALIAASPPNVHYFFVSRKFDSKAALASERKRGNVLRKPV